MFPFSRQAGAEQAFVQRLRVAATPHQAQYPSLAQANLDQVVGQSFQIRQAGIQTAFVGHVVGQVQGQFLLRTGLGTAGRSRRQAIAGTTCEH
ncbi:hypothetical protein D9M73_212400 [compost metagenome]